ncbi:MAG: superoxide dismutase [Alphaproteobacteria bacterium]|nr:superoxide dismutase [Alphaproteobacteria bacterium]
MLEIKPLKYDLEALAPIISSQTLFFHHDKHYAGYVVKANELLPPKWKHKNLEELVSLAREKGENALFNQVAQVWNHEFFFDGLSVSSEDHKISDDLMFYIRKDYNSVDNLKAELIKTAMARFGSGWVWLVLDGEHLKIQSTLNAETPCGQKGFVPLWTLDVWEHAYYLDYQNKRLDYATEVVNKAINWRLVNERLGI